LGLKVLGDLKKIFKTQHPVVIYPASGTGAWEAALVNVLSPGDQVVMYETGQFATLWKKMADRLGIGTEFIGLPGLEGWRRGVQADLIEARLKQDTAHKIKAVCVVHNETSTGVTSNIAAVRAAMDGAKHPALLLVDTISGLASADYRHDEWGVDVTVSGSQKGLMLPPGISFNALSPRAIEVSKTAKLPKAFWAWDEMLEMNKTGYFPYTPSTNLLYGLHEALDMILGEGLDNVFARHQRLARACRAAVQGWGLQIQCADADVYSPVLTGVMTPEGVDADQVRRVIYERFDTSLGTGLGKVKGKMFRIGHLGECNDVSLMGTLAARQGEIHFGGGPGDGCGQHTQSCRINQIEFRRKTPCPSIKLVATWSRPLRPPRCLPAAPRLHKRAGRAAT
jgi:alanine-glyoxylate transaminase/serine-glyoxylate transaminase/serine-pyruvate transaminase